MKFLHLIASACLVGLCSCGGQSNAIPYSYDFSQGQQGWQAGDSNYSPAVTAEVNFSAGMQPSPLAPHQMTFHLYGNNVSDNLFLYAKKQVTGLLAGHSYSVAVKTTLISQTGVIGGSSKIIKLGASTIEPRTVLGANSAGPYYFMNIDIGGPFIVTCGNLSGTGTSNPESLTFTTPKPIVVQSDANGTLWLLAGVGSGFEVPTEVYYTEISASVRQ